MGNNQSFTDCSLVPEDGPISIKVEGGRKREIIFEKVNVDPTTFTIQQLKEEFQKKHNIEPINQKYYHNNLRLDPMGTLKQHKIKNNDVISVLYGRNVIDSD